MSDTGAPPTAPAPENRTFRRRTTLLVGLSIAAGLLLLRGNQFGEWFFHLSPLQSRDLFWWPLLPAMLVYVRFVEQRPLRSIGLSRPTWLTLVVGVGFALVAHYPVNWLAGTIVSGLHIPIGASNAAASAIDQSPLWYRVLIVTRGAVVEEVLFRGYMIERIEELTGSCLLAATFSIVFFMYAHLAYWGWVPLVFVGLAGILASAIYLWRRDLWANILGHWITDALAVF